jgi:hypothetical protein
MSTGASRPQFRSQLLTSGAAMRIVIVLLTLTVLLSRTGGAQGSRHVLAVGDRVRISAPTLGDGPRLVRIVASSADTLVVRPVDARDFTVTVPLTDIQRIEVSSGHRPRKARFALIGLAAGSVAGAVVGAASYSDPCVKDPAICAGWFYETRGGDAFAGAIAGALLGTVGGAVLGQLWQRETWTALPLTRVVRLELAPHTRMLASRSGSRLVGVRIVLR